MSKELETVQLNVLSVRGTGFPEERLCGSTSASIVRLTQAPEVFAERTADSVASCVAVGPAWSQEEPYLLQILERAPESATILMPAGDIKLAHLIGVRGFEAFVTYADDSDWVALVETASSYAEALETLPNLALALLHPLHRLRLLFRREDSGSKWYSVTR